MTQANDAVMLLHSIRNALLGIDSMVTRLAGLAGGAESGVHLVLAKDQGQAPLWRVDSGGHVAGWFDTGAQAERFIRDKAFRPEECRIVYDEHPEKHPEWPESAA